MLSYFPQRNEEFVKCICRNVKTVNEWNNVNNNCILLLESIFVMLPFLSINHTRHAILQKEIEIEKWTYTHKEEADVRFTVKWSFFINSSDILDSAWSHVESHIYTKKIFVTVASDIAYRTTATTSEQDILGTLDVLDLHVLRVNKTNIR